MNDSGDFDLDITSDEKPDYDDFVVCVNLYWHDDSDYWKLEATMNFGQYVISADISTTGYKKTTKTN